MMRIALLLIPLSLIVMSGCSRDTVQRTGYETLRNMEQQRCLEQGTSTSPCPKGDSYEEYQRQRQELEQDQ